MCGIVGKVRFDGRPVAELDLQRMNAALAHRGPDASGVYVSPDRIVGLGSQRLAVLDLSPRGHQPLRFADRYEVVFNGEIYNFRELRMQLEREGVRFHSQTDTEVLVALYAREGADCLQKLRGMFAFAIYDERDGVLFCARDRLGKKPFKYFRNGSGFLFASEAKALFTQPECPRVPDFPALRAYLALQYVPAPATGFEGVAKLPAAHCLILNVRTGELTTERYWELDFRRKQLLARGEWIERLRRTLTDAVRLRMVADVPLGALLSGGMDSSAVVALMSEGSDRPVRTFTVGFGEDGADERPYARLVAQRFRTEHHELVVHPRDLFDLDRLVRTFEEPFGDASALPTFHVCRLARREVTVALTGDGGDENFGGYLRYSVHALALRLERLRLLRAVLTSGGAYLLASALPRTAGFRAARFLESLALPLPERHARYVGYFTDPRLFDALRLPRGLTSAPGDPLASLRAAFASVKATDPLDRVFAADLLTYLPDDLLPKMDLASMATALEARSPFLDHELLELTAQMPHTLKVRGVVSRKWIVKRALADLLPEPVLRRPKRGFSPPLDAWFRGELKGVLRGTLLSDRALQRGLFQKEAVTGLINAHVDRRVNLGKFLFLLLVLELWFQQWIDASPAGDVAVRERARRVQDHAGLSRAPM